MIEHNFLNKFYFKKVILLSNFILLRLILILTQIFIFWLKFSLKKRLGYWLIDSKCILIFAQKFCLGIPFNLNFRIVALESSAYTIVKLKYNIFLLFRLDRHRSNHSQVIDHIICWTLPRFY